MSSAPISPSLLAIWRFLRRDLTEAQFEALIYENDALEQLLGPALYLDVISTIYHDPDQVDAIRRQLEAFARAETPLGCDCITLGDLSVVDMSADCTAFSRLDKVAERGPARWWLTAWLCRECGQGWLVGEESRQNDVYCFRRLTGDELDACRSGDRWPADFDAYEALLGIGLANGRSVRWVDPYASRSLGVTIADLARERPGIRVSELAKLLALDAETARAIAERIASEEGVDIDMEAERPR